MLHVETSLIFGVDFISIIIRFNLFFYFLNSSSIIMFLAAFRRLMFLATDDGKESEPSTSSSVEWSQPCHQFEFSEIKLATNNFDESLVIGSGGFGKVYKVNLSNGSNHVVVAIKRLDSMSNQGADEFWAEVEMLSKLRHCNLVSLIGYCNYESEMILVLVVYEYMPNGTLEDHLHKRGTPLSWIQRLKICIGAGRGLHYLHTGTGIESGVIHRDVKSSNILLHESWAAKISDFGLSKIGPTNQPSTYVNTLIKGTFGYLDPNYFATGKLTRKSDVYAFGVVLFEVLCRKRAVDRSLDEEQWSLAVWAQESIKDGNLKHIIDSDIRGEISPKCFKEFVRIAESCLHSNPKQRPTMAEVVVSLESVRISQEKMNKSLQAAGGTIFDKMLNMFPFSNRENLVQCESKLSSNSEAINRNNLERVQRNLGLSSSLKVFTFSDLKTATRNFRKDFILGEGSFGKVFLGWIDPNTLTPSTSGAGIAVAVKRLKKDSMQGHAEWEDFNAKLGDFGLVKSGPEIGKTHVSTRVMGTFGYGDPAYVMTGRLTTKSDIYSFGVALLESLTGRKTVDYNRPVNEHSLVNWAKPVLANKRNIKKIVDPRLGQNYPLEDAFRYAGLVLRCLADNPKDRPASEEVLQSLEQIHAISR